MPTSSHRQRHKHGAHASDRHGHTDIKNSSKHKAAILMAMFIGILGLAIGAMATGANQVWMTVSTLIGLVAGGLIGNGIDKSLHKRGA